MQLANVSVPVPTGFVAGAGGDWLNNPPVVSRNVNGIERAPGA